MKLGSSEEMKVQKIASLVLELMFLFKQKLRALIKQVLCVNILGNIVYYLTELLLVRNLFILLTLDLCTTFLCCFSNPNCSKKQKRKRLRAYYLLKSIKGLLEYQMAKLKKSEQFTAGRAEEIRQVIGGTPLSTFNFKFQTPFLFPL